MNDNRNSFNKNSFPFDSNKHQSAFLLKGNNQHFKISDLHNDFEHDVFATQEFIDIALSDLENLKEKMFDAFQQNDLTTYKQVHYRTITTLKMIQANPLQDLLKQGMDLMEGAKNESTEMFFSNMEQEFSTVLTLLKTLKSA